MSSDEAFLHPLAIFYPSYFGIATFLQLALLFLIVRRISISLTRFKWIMRNTCVLQTLSIFTVCCAQFRVVSNQLPVELRCYGLIRFLRWRFGYYLYQAMQVFSQMSYLSILASMYMKFRAVREEKELSGTRRTKLKVALASPLILTVIMEIIAVITVATVKPVSGIDVTPSGTGYSVVAISFKDLPGVINFGITCAGSLIVPSIALMKRRKLLKYINSHHDKSSFLRKEQNSSFVNGLTIQAASPLLCYVPIYALHFYSLITSEEILFQQYFMTILPALPTLLDPFVVLFFVPPFWRKIKICLRVERAATVTPQTSAFMSGMSIIITFYLKFEAVRSVELSNFRVFFVVFVFHFPILISVAMEIIMIVTQALPLEVRERFEQLNVNVDEYAVIGALSLKTAPSFINFLLISGSAVISPFLSLFFRNRILCRINSHLDKSSQVKKTHNCVFVKGLTIQAVLPIIFYLPVFGLYFFCLLTHAEILFQQYFMTVVPVLPAFFDPLLTLYFVTPYRRRIKIWMRIEKESKVQPMFTSQINN